MGDIYDINKKVMGNLGNDNRIRIDNRVVGYVEGKYIKDEDLTTRGYLENDNRVYSADGRYLGKFKPNTDYVVDYDDNAVGIVLGDHRPLEAAVYLLLLR